MFACYQSENKILKTLFLGNFDTLKCWLKSLFLKEVKSQVGLNLSLGEVEGGGELLRHISHRFSAIDPTSTDLASWLSEGGRLFMTYSIKNCLGMWQVLILSQSRSLSLSSVVVTLGLSWCVVTQKWFKGRYNIFHIFCCWLSKLCTKSNSMVVQIYRLILQF